MRRALVCLGFLALASGCNASVDATEPQCTDTRLFSQPWDELSDAELRVEIARACGRVFVGFKEEGPARGVDPQGRNLTTAETVNRMKRYLVERGVTIEWQGGDLPHVSARMPTHLQLVRELRRHPNVDYLEPIFPGTFLNR
jgi:hypothetical protein